MPTDKAKVQQFFPREGYEAVVVIPVGHIAEDMVIERGDNTINLCEMKFSESEFAINKDYEKILRNKIVRFREETKTRKSIQLTFISSYGLQRNMYSGIAQNEVVLNDLF